MNAEWHEIVDLLWDYVYVVKINKVVTVCL